MTERAQAYISVSQLRHMNADAMRALQGPVVVMTQKPLEPLSALIPYDWYMKAQALLAERVTGSDDPS